MRKKLRALTVIVLTICLCFNSSYAQASSSEKKEAVDNLKQEVDDASNAVSNIKNQKQETENAKNELENQASALTGKISSLNSQITNVTADINSTEATIADVEADIAALKADIEETQASLDLQRDSMKLRIQYMYENQTTNQLVALLECGSITALLSRLEYLIQITTYDQEAIAKYEETQAKLDAANKEAEAKHEELVAYQNELNNKKSKLGTLMSTTKTALNDTNTAIGEHNDKLADLEKQLKDAQAYEASIKEAYMKAQAELAMSLAGEKGGYTGGYSSTDEETLLLAALIQAEADNQGDAGRLAVGSVVMNRVNSSKFPNTVAGVIYQSGQFAPVASGRVALILAQGPHSWCQTAAALALAGNINTNALFFCTYTYAQVMDQRRLEAGKESFFDATEGVVLNAHYFYNYK